MRARRDRHSHASCSSARMDRWVGVEGHFFANKPIKSSCKSIHVTKLPLRLENKAAMQPAGVHAVRAAA